MNRRTRYMAAFMQTLFFLILFAGSTQAYIMPAEQLLYLMATRFPGTKTMIITQSTHLENHYDPETDIILNEKIWLKAPDLCASELIDIPDDSNIERSSVTDGEPRGDMAFRRLFMTHGLEPIMSLLSEMGVDIKLVSLTREGGIVAYRLGEEDPRSPKLVVEKDTFLPLSFCYMSHVGFDLKMVTVRFGDYQKVGKGWYPYEIIYSCGEDVLERYVIRDIQVNLPFEQPLSKINVKQFSPSRDLGVSEGANEKDKELREVIELLKKKYE